MNTNTTMFEAVDQVWPIVAEGPLQILEKSEGISFYKRDASTHGFRP